MKFLPRRSRAADVEVDGFEADFPGRERVAELDQRIRQRVGGLIPAERNRHRVWQADAPAVLKMATFQTNRGPWATPTPDVSM